MATNNPFLAVDRQMIGDIHTTTEVLDNLTFLCDECGSRFPGTPGERQAVEFMQAKMREYGLQNVHAEPFPYSLQGVPTSCMERANRRPGGGRGYGHTHYDTLDKVEIGPLRVASERAARWLLRIAQAQEWPITRRTPAAAQALLETPAYRETAELRAQVDAFYAARR